jgi:hypothetical protein
LKDWSSAKLEEWAMKPRRLTMLTVDTGPEQRSRFYRLVVGGRGSDDSVREELLVPDGDELRTTHRHETTGEAA